MFFCSLNSRSHDLVCLKLTHMTLSSILMLNPNFNFLVLPFASYKQINPHQPKFANKNKGQKLHTVADLEVLPHSSKKKKKQKYYALARSPNNFAILNDDFVYDINTIIAIHFTVITSQMISSKQFYFNHVPAITVHIT